MVLAAIGAVLLLGVVFALLVFFRVRATYREMDEADARRREEQVVFEEPVPGPPPSDTVFTTAEVDELPRFLNREEFAALLQRSYPPLLRDAGVTGQAVLQFRVGSDGAVDPASVRVTEATHDAFARAAAGVAGRMRFRPARREGRPVSVHVELPITFALEQPPG